MRVFGPTGVEMEALTAVTAAALTIYDMAKAVDKGMTLGPAYLVSKEGGRSGLNQQFHGHVTRIQGGDPDLQALLLHVGTELLLAPRDAEVPPGAVAVAWLDAPGLGAMRQGQKLACGTLLVVPQTANVLGHWTAVVRRAGVLRVGDRLGQLPTP